jgi:hypothetical protein
MEINDQAPAKVREIAETQDRAELRRAAHKIAWARMNGSNDAANPFGEANPDRLAPGNGTK